MQPGPYRCRGRERPFVRHPGEKSVQLANGAIGPTSSSAVERGRCGEAATRKRATEPAASDRRDRWLRRTRGTAMPPASSGFAAIGPSSVIRPAAVGWLTDASAGPFRSLRPFGRFPSIRRRVGQIALRRLPTVRPDRTRCIGRPMREVVEGEGCESKEEDGVGKRGQPSARSCSSFARSGREGRSPTRSFLGRTAPRPAKANGWAGYLLR